MRGRGVSRGGGGGRGRGPGPLDVPTILGVRDRLKELWNWKFRRLCSRLKLARQLCVLPNLFKRVDISQLQVFLDFGLCPLRGRMVKALHGMYCQITKYARCGEYHILNVENTTYSM